MDKKKVFNNLYSSHIGFVIFFCQKSFRFDKSTAEDVAQAAFLKAFHNLESLKDTTKFRSWILTIVKNEAMDHIRKNKRYLSDNIDHELIGSSDGVGKKKDLELMLINLFLKELPESTDNGIFKAFYLEGKKVSEIAAQFELKEGTVTTKLSRMRVKFKGQLLKKIVELRERLIHG